MPCFTSWPSRMRRLRSIGTGARVGPGRAGAGDELAPTGEQKHPSVQTHFDSRSQPAHLPPNFAPLLNEASGKDTHFASDATSLGGRYLGESRLGVLSQNRYVQLSFQGRRKPKDTGSKLLWRDRRTCSHSPRTARPASRRVSSTSRTKSLHKRRVGQEHMVSVCGKRTSTASVKQCHLLATSRPTAGAAWVCTLASDAYAAWAHLFFGRYHMSDLDKIGGIPVVMRESHTNRELDVKRVAYRSLFFP